MDYYYYPNDETGGRCWIDPWRDVYIECHR